MSVEVHRELTLLHPKLLPLALLLRDNLDEAFARGQTRTNFRVFETYRTPQRQTLLLAEGNSKAGPFSSPHQFGLAVDFVPYPWSWDASHDWDFLKQQAEAVGLGVPIKWDRCHVEWPRWPRVLQAVRGA